MSNVYIPRKHLSEEEEDQIIEAATEQGFEVENYGILLQVTGLEDAQAQYLLRGLGQMGVQDCWRSDR